MGGQFNVKNTYTPVSYHWQSEMCLITPEIACAHPNYPKNIMELLPGSYPGPSVAM